MRLQGISRSALVCFLVALAASVALVPVVVAHDDLEVDPPSGEGTRTSGRINCEEGLVVTETFSFPCRDVDLLAWDSLGALPTFANDIWGWTDPATGREYAIMGLFDGAAFFDLGDPEHPVHLGTLPSASGSSFWADIKVHANHAYIVKDVAGDHGLQVFDLTQLREVSHPPVAFAETFHYTLFGEAHNLAINEDTGFLYAIGSDTCSGGLHIVDLTDPANPDFAGCFSDEDRLHDAQCVSYSGPDSDHEGREVCFAADPSGVDTLDIIDVEDKQAPRLLSKTEYLNLASLGYAHQGWLTEDQRYFLMGDEFDEIDAGHNTRTYVFDVSDLDSPSLIGHYEGGVSSTDHNLYIRDDHVFEANYSAGLRILSMGDPAALELEEIAFFDSFPPGDQAGTGFGPWSVYPFFDSGIVIVSDLLLGLFVLQPRVLEIAPIQIEIHPGSRPAAIQPASRGVTPVVVLGSDTLAVEDIEPSSLAFGPAGAPLAHRNGPHPRDANRDGIPDLLAHFRTAEAGLLPGEEAACITGETLDGTPFEGCDSIRTVPPE